jgi:Double zinc ribbon
MPRARLRRHESRHAPPVAHLVLVRRFPCITQTKSKSERHIKMKVNDCPSCEAPSPAGSKYCQYCAKRLRNRPIHQRSNDSIDDIDAIRCPSCHTRAFNDAFYCPNCGKAFPASVRKESSTDTYHKKVIVEKRIGKAVMIGVPTILVAVPVATVLAPATATAAMIGVSAYTIALAATSVWNSWRR